MYFSAIDTRALHQDRSLFLDAVIASAVGILAGAALFSSEVSLVSVFLIVIAQGQMVRALLDRNRAAIYEQAMPPRQANLRLARSLWTLFIGVFVTYLLVAGLAPLDRVEAWFERQLGGFAGRGPADLHFGTFGELFSHNAGVLGVSFLFALVYRHGGMLLVLCWNASRWGVVLGAVSRRGAGDDPLAALASIGRTLAAILPHMALEALAYVLAAMAGVFIAKALEKHPMRSPAFRRVLGAAAAVATLSAVTLAAAAAVEAVAAPALVRWMVPAAPPPQVSTAAATPRTRPLPAPTRPVRPPPTRVISTPVRPAVREPPPHVAPIRLEPRPPAAVVVVDGAVAGAGPTTLARPAPGQSAEVEVRLRGYRTARVTVGPDSPEIVIVTLERAPPAPIGPAVRE